MAASLTLFAGVIVLVLGGVSPSGTKVLREQLIGSGSSFSPAPATPSQFTLDGSITGLYPDIPNKFLVLTVHNPNPVPIDVTSITVTAADAKPTCLKENLVITNFTGHLTVNAKSSALKGLPATLVHSAPKACMGAAWNLTYAGTATGSSVSTTTGLTSSQNASTVGQSVTFTATVTGGPSSSGTPTGTITFLDGATTLGTANLDGTGTATLTTTALTAGTHPITASYGGDGAFFSTSTSTTLNQVVNKASKTLTLSNSPTTSIFGQTVTLSASMAASTAPAPNPTGPVSFYEGTSAGTHTLLGTANLNSSVVATMTISSLPGGSDPLYAVYSGDGNFNSATSNPVTQTVGYTQTISGNTGGLTVGNGQSVLLTGKANGTVTVQPGGALTVSGGTINGSFTSTGAKAITLCGSSVTGGVSVSGTTGFVLIGDAGDDGSPACAGNTITGGASLTNNTGGIELGGNTKISGGVTFNNNTGAGPAAEDAVPEIEANSITGGLTCSTNPVTDDHKPNTVSGSRTGPCAGSF